MVSEKRTGVGHLRSPKKAILLNMTMQAGQISAECSMRLWKGRTSRFGVDLVVGGEQGGADGGGGHGVAFGGRAV